MNEIRPDNCGLGFMKINYWYWSLVLLIVVMSTLIRIRLLGVPLDRDTGEYAYAAQLILEGKAPYTHLYNMKMPGIYAAYALIFAFLGQTHISVHLGLAVLNAATIFLIFLLAKKLLSHLAAVASAAAFALLSLGLQIRGTFAKAEHFVIFFAVGGIFLLLRSIGQKSRFKLFVGAVSLGLAFLMKQHGFAFIAFGGLYLAGCGLRRRPFVFGCFLTDCLIFIAGVLLPFAVTCQIFWWCGAFDKFWFWTFSYASKYASAVSLSDGLEILRRRIAGIVTSAILLWSLAGVGFGTMFWNEKAGRHILFFVGFLLFSFLAVCPGFYFRPHYFILLLPSVALLAGVGVDSVHRLFERSRLFIVGRIIPISLALLAIGHVLYQQWDFLFVMSPTAASRAAFGISPFPESLEIARFIKERSAPTDRIAVLGSEPQIYFYSDRRSATGYIYTYPLMESHAFALQMQKEMISEIEAVSPKFLILVHIPSSWAAGPDSNQHIFDWFNSYCNNHYVEIGLIDIYPEHTIYRWNDQAGGYEPRSKDRILVFERKTSTD
ncbi:MAG TPA: hypothetical protein HPP87_04860 [Planctomycetes bacterium]|nr:hypothetical protein [Planctomycetota bacterium]